MRCDKMPLLEKVQPFLNRIIRFFQFRRKRLKLEIETIINDFQISYDQLCQENEQLKEIEVKSQELSDLLEAQTAETNRVQALESDAHNQIIKLNKQYEVLSKEHSVLVQKYDFFETVFSVETLKNSAMENFSNLFQKDFINFANQESSLAAEAEAVLTMQSIVKELEMITGFPDIFGKSLIALAGGFSSGKSSFVNSFFSNNEIELPVGIKPVTAIPTYVVAGNKYQIRGYSNNGGSFEISPEMFHLLSHDYINQFRFSINKIIPYIALSANIGGLDKICFIDTPGYNSPGTGKMECDMSYAAEATLQADSLLWFIPVDSSGTLTTPDIMFLQKLDLQNKKLYIVINKADLRPLCEIEEIMNTVSDSLDAYSISCCGISAYSAKQRKEYRYENLSLIDFFKEHCNGTCMTQKKIVTKIDSVLDSYQEAIKNNLAILNNRKKTLHSIRLDLIQLAVDTDETVLDERLTDLHKSCDSTILEKQLLTLRKIKKDMHEAVNDIFSSFNPEKQVTGNNETTKDNALPKQKKLAHSR